MVHFPNPHTQLVVHVVHALTEHPLRSSIACVGLPGTYSESVRNNRSRVDHLHEVVEQWPHLVSVDVENMFRLIRLDIVKFDGMLKKYGHAAFGGGFQSWPPVWKAKDELSFTNRQRPDEHETTHNHLTFEPAGSLDEWINIAALGEAIDADRAQTKVEEDSVSLATPRGACNVACV